MGTVADQRYHWISEYCNGQQRDRVAVWGDEDHEGFVSDEQWQQMLAGKEVCVEEDGQYVYYSIDDTPDEG